jgi:hypothetical protein
MHAPFSCSDCNVIVLRSPMGYDQFGAGAGKAAVGDLAAGAGMMPAATPNMPSMMMGANLVGHGMMNSGARPPFMNNNSNNNNNKALRMRGGGRGRGM